MTSPARVLMRSLWTLSLRSNRSNLESKKVSSTSVERSQRSAGLASISSPSQHVHAGWRRTGELHSSQALLSPPPLYAWCLCARSRAKSKELGGLNSPRSVKADIHSSLSPGSPPNCLSHESLREAVRLCERDSPGRFLEGVSLVLGSCVVGSSV